jgi:hypothetical protein
VHLLPFQLRRLRFAKATMESIMEDTEREGNIMMNASRLEEKLRAK